LLEDKNLAEWSSAVREYMQALRLNYGRLDFILHDDELYFLECNTNGEFGWLDDSQSLTLHRKFLDAALNKNTTVK
jgi:D-alanine-D-alanine ligase-like ATP-grasp enzyme